MGLKPTFGRVSTEGAFPLSPSLDHIGPMAATVHEAALLLDAISDADAASRIGQPIRGLRVGFAREWHATDPACSPAVTRALDDAAAVLSLLGARIVPLSLPDYPLFEAAGSLILHVEALEVHRDLIAAHAQDYGRPVLQCLAFGAAVDQDDLARARAAQARLTTETLAAMAGVDLLLTAATLTPALPFAAFDGETAVWTPMRTIPFNVTGQPALVLPCGFQDGLPLGMQLIGRAGDEAVLCMVGHAFEQATDFSVQRP